MYVPIPTHASPTEAQAFNRALQQLLGRDFLGTDTPGTKKALERYGEAARNAMLVQTVRERLAKLESAELLRPNQPALIHLVGVLAFEGSDASVAVVRTLVDSIVAARTEASPEGALLLLGHYRRVLANAPGAFAAEQCTRVRAAYQATFARTQASALFESIGVAIPDDQDWSVSLTHVAETGHAQVWASHDGGFTAEMTTTGLARRVLIDRGKVLSPSGLPALDDVRRLREHLQACVATAGLTPWDWSQTCDATQGPYGASFKFHGLKPHARKALEAWWLGTPQAALKKAAKKPESRFERFIPADVEDRAAVRASLCAFDKLDAWPRAPKHLERIRELAANATLVRTLVAWLNEADAEDEAFFYLLSVLAYDPSPSANAALERVVERALQNREPRELWQYLEALQNARPEHPRVPALANAWLDAFTPTPGGRLLRSIGVAPPTNEAWEVVLMARQPRGDTTIEIYPWAFFRAEASVEARPGVRELYIADDAKIEDVREHFDQCARKAKLKPWNLAATWNAEHTPNGSVVKVKGFARDDVDKIKSWFRDWKPRPR